MFLLAHGYGRYLSEPSLDRLFRKELVVLMETKVEIDAHPQQTYLRTGDHHFSESVSPFGNFLLCVLFKDHFKAGLCLQGVEEGENG